MILLCKRIWCLEQKQNYWIRNDASNIKNFKYPILKIIHLFSIFFDIFIIINSLMSSKRRVGIAHFLLRTFEMLEVQKYNLQISKDSETKTSYRMVNLRRLLLHQKLQRICEQSTLFSNLITRSFHSIFDIETFNHS